ncbi:glycosyltransferase family 4 protein [Thioalkalicoccus limnaeus]|uniref:Glycosyltransferase family 4 protein n=1 Tax=Thioalkalicoccus limnaeus TaxID=120681 RepID=A0ABV4BC48_9GAMM
MAYVLMAAYTNYRRDPRVKREAEALVEQGHRVVFLARRQPGEPNRETIAGVDVIKTIGLRNKCNSVAEYLADYSLFFVMISLHLLAHPLRYRLVHINNMPDFLVFAAWLPRLLGRPIIHDIHDLMPELYLEKFSSGEGHWGVRALKAQERWAGRFASAVLTVEERLRDILTGRGIPHEKIHVLMNLPDERIFAPRSTLRPKPEGSPFVLVYHGTLARRLGLDIAIEAVAKAKEAIPEMKFRIIGAGEEREELIRLRDRLRLQDIVTFSEGFVPVERIPAMVEDADVGLIPLRVCSGTDIMLPTKLLEYVAMGIPCIVPKTGTISRYFDEEMVQFFEAEDSASLADAITALHRDPDRRSWLAAQATKRFGKPFRWSEHQKVYLNLVDRLIADQ